MSDDDLLARAVAATDRVRTIVVGAGGQQRRLRSSDGDVTLRVDGRGVLRGIDLSADWTTRRTWAQVADLIDHLLAPCDHREP